MINGDKVGVAVLKETEYYWSWELDLEEIQNDTYAHWTEEDFRGLLRNFYQNDNVYLIKLIFEWVEVIPKGD